MVVKDKRTDMEQEQIHDNFMAVLFKINQDLMPCRLVKLIKGKETGLFDSTLTFEPEPYHLES